MSKFTCGNWHLDPLTGEVHANGSRIAKVYGATAFNHEQNASGCQANARLILNAPEMYELLKLFAYPEEPCTARTLEVSNKVWKLLRNIDGEETEA